MSMRFGTVGSPNSTPPKPGGSIGAIQRIEELGLNAFELGWVQSVRVSEETCTKIRKESEKRGVAISVHAPYFINLNADDEEWPKSRKRLWDAAYFGTLAGATDIIFHPGSYFGLRPDEVLSVAIPRLRSISDELQKRKIKVTLRPELMGKQGLLGSLYDVLKMSFSVERVMPCIDFAHLYARDGKGENNSIESFRKVIQEIEKTIGKNSLQLIHIHLSGIEFTEKGEKKHLPIRESKINLSGLFDVLVNTHVSGRILCESPILEDDAVYMRDLWKQKGGAV